MLFHRANAEAAVCNGKIIVCGGDTGKKLVNSVECFDPESGIWTELAKMAAPLYWPVAFSRGNKLIVMGGHTTETFRGSAVWELDLLEDKAKWIQLKSTRYGCILFSGTALDNEIYIMGGYDSN